MNWTSLLVFALGMELSGPTGFICEVQACNDIMQAMTFT
jgi:hypothetical protein